MSKTKVLLTQGAVALFLGFIMGYRVIPSALADAFTLNPSMPVRALFFLAVGLAYFWGLRNGANICYPFSNPLSRRE